MRLRSGRPLVARFSLEEDESGKRHRADVEDADHADRQPEVGGVDHRAGDPDLHGQLDPRRLSGERGRQAFSALRHCA